MQIKSFELKIKEKAIKDHFVEYNHALQEIIAHGDDINNLILHDFCSDIDKEELTTLSSTMRPSMAKLVIIRTLVAMNSLADEDRRVIKEDFIRPNNKSWWEKEYSRSKYYRRRQRAIENFYSIIH